MTQAAADVAVVGAGFAGLSAARDIAAAGRSVLVLEARSRPGGRTDAQELAPGLVVDMGGAYAGDDQTELLAAAREVGIAALPVQHTGGTEVRLGARGERVESGGGFAPQTLQLVAEIDRMAEQVPLDAPWAAPGARELDAVSCADWLRSHATTVAERELTQPIRGFMGDPATFSLLHLLFYSRSNGGVAAFAGIGERHDSLEFDGSLHAIARGMAQALGDSVAYEAPVHAVSRGEGGVVIEAHGLTVSAARCVVACAPPLAAAIRFDPPLDPDRAALMQSMPLLSQGKAQVLYHEPFWRAAGMSGTGVTRLIETYDSSPRSGGAGVLTVFTGDAVEDPGLADLTPDARRERVLTEVAALWGPAGVEPLAYAERDWAREPFSRGCVMYMPPGLWTSAGHAIRRPCGPVHWAGAETATEYCGNIEGAIRSGRRAAAEVLEALG